MTKSSELTIIKIKKTYHDEATNEFSFAVPQAGSPTVQNFLSKDGTRYSSHETTVILKAKGASIDTDE